MIDGHHIEEANQRRLVREEARKSRQQDEIIVSKSAKKNFFFCVLVRFSPKMQRHETPEALVQEIINDPRARTLLENLISNTVAPKVSATLLQLFSCYVRLNMS